MAEYKPYTYLLMTLDPVHIGTGGYRLGRVDNSIVREPGTRVPKVPGTALHGAIRSYAAMVFETPEAAGQKHDDVPNPDKNPVCYTFGYIQKTKSGDEEKVVAHSGVVSIFDAHILLFPVYSMEGPVWVTTLQRLKDARFKVRANNGEKISEPAKEKMHISWSRSSKLNLGWIMLEIEKDSITVEPNSWEVKVKEVWEKIKNRIVIVNESIFHHIVNSNLEVRTSVSINPETGAAEEGALFTYEAIPRATFLTMDIVVDDYKGSFPKSDRTAKGNPLPKKWENPLTVVDSGLELLEYLGVGGMGTRGFGRLRKVGELKNESTR